MATHADDDDCPECLALWERLGRPDLLGWMRLEVAALEATGDPGWAPRLDELRAAIARVSAETN